MSDIENTVAEINETAAPITAAQGKNDKRRSDLNRMVSKLGEESSLGRDSLPKLAHAVVKAAADGVITSADAEDVYGRYAAAESKKAIHEHSSGGKKANISKLKQLIAMGEMQTIDGLMVMDEAMTVRDGLIAAEEKVKSAYAYYVDVARAQLKSEDGALSEEDLVDIALKPEANEKTLEGELTRAMKILDGLISGENKSKLKDEDALTEQAFNALRDRIAAIQMINKRAELVKKAKELGLSLT